jgi:hypothetical protein
MKWYLLTLFLLVGLVWSASAQKADPRLVGEWETTDGPCKPCTLTIQENGGVKFDMAGGPLEVVYAQVTAEPGVDIIGPQGGKLDLSLTTSSKYLVGYFTSYTDTRRNQSVVFRRK